MTTTPRAFACSARSAVGSYISDYFGVHTWLIAQVESMTTNPMAWEGAINPRVAENQCAQDCLLPMGEPGHCFGWL